MRLADLHPEYIRQSGKKGLLSFDCPACTKKGIAHRITHLPVYDGESCNTGIYRWGITWTPPGWDSVSLTPSVNYNNEHWHGTIIEGEVT
jgi:hypothetical protein